MNNGRKQTDTKATHQNPSTSHKDKAKTKELYCKADGPSIKAMCVQQSHPHKLAALAAITARQE